MKKNDPRERTNEAKCDVCGHTVWLDQYGNGDKCLTCGWRQSEESSDHPDIAGIRNIPSLNNARRLYEQGKSPIADFSDFINALESYSEMEFTYEKIRYGVLISNDSSIVLHFRISEKEIARYESIEEFRNKGSINGVLLKDLWVNVENTNFLQ